MISFCLCRNILQHNGSSTLKNDVEVAKIQVQPMFASLDESNVVEAFEYCKKRDILG